MSGGTPAGGERLRRAGGPWLVVGLVLSLVSFVAAMGWQSSVWPTHRTQPAPLGALLVYWLSFTLVWGLLTALAWRLRRGDGCGRAFTPSLSRRRLGSTGLLILLVAALVRVAVVFTSSPTLSDDIWRYIHDGATLAAGTSPYAHAPAEADHQHWPISAVAERINHPELVTIYQPVSQLTFAGLHQLHARLPAVLRQADPLRDMTFRLGFVAVDLVIVVLLLGVLRSAGRSPWWAALYAWHPLAVSEVAGSGHQDVLGIALLLAALMVAQRVGLPHTHGLDSPRRKAGVPWSALGAGVLLAGAAAVKPIVLPLALPMAWRWRRRPGAIAGALIAGGVTLTGLYLPFAWTGFGGEVGGAGLAGMLETGRTLIDKWAFNSSLHGLAGWALGAKARANGLMAALLLAVVVALMLARVDLFRTAGLYLLAALLLSSTVHPWYALWLLALVPLRFAWSAWLLSVTIVLSYGVYLHPEHFQPAPWLRWLAYLPVYLALVGELVHSTTRCGWRPADRSASRPG